MTSIADETKKRDTLYDNIRAVLIILVVFCHLNSSRLSESEGLKVFYHFTYLFHMPAFVFITGFFSKNVERDREKAMETFLIPYLIFNTAFAGLNYFMTAPDKNFLDFYRMTVPQWGMWFLPACFIWKMFAKDLLRIRFIIPFSLLAGLFLPFFSDFNYTFTIGRIFGLLFFFMAGLYTPTDWIERIKKFPIWSGWLALFAFLVITYLIVTNKWIDQDVLYFSSPYEDGKKLLQAGMRLFQYVIGTLIIIALIVAIPRKSCILSEIGRNTLTIYIFHLFIVFALKQYKILADRIDLYVLLTVALAILISFILSRRWVRQGYHAFMNFINHMLFKS